MGNDLPAPIDRSNAVDQYFRAGSRAAVTFGILNKR
jgi:hypothetical protein